MGFLTAKVQQFSSIVDSIYDAAMVPGHWPAVLASIAAWLDAPKALLITPTHTPELGGFHFHHGISALTMHEWQHRYAPDDLWANAALRGGLFQQSSVVLGSDLVPRAELVTSSWYAHFLLPARIEHLMSGVVFGLETSGTPPVVCSLFREPGAVDFSIDDRDKLAALIPHLSRGVGAMFKLDRLAWRGALAEAALGRLQFGVIATDSEGRMLLANERACQRLAPGNALSLTPSGHLLANGAFNAVLQRTIRQTAAPARGATSHFASVLQLPGRPGDENLTLQFSSMGLASSAAMGVPGAAVLIFMTGEQADRLPSVDLIRAALGISAAEARVARAALREDGVRQIAAALSLSSNTVKSHLKSIYAKTAVTSRAQLAARLASLPPLHPCADRRH